VERLRKAGIEVAIFLDPDGPQIEAAKRLGAVAVELQTARYSEARPPARAELKTLEEAAAVARSLKLGLHLGHGLNYTNVQAVARIGGVAELNIGHSIVSRAVLVGMERAVREMKDAIREGELSRSS
jgi:pyridoxine 5-phosphate synthase